MIAVARPFRDRAGWRRRKSGRATGALLAAGPGCTVQAVAALALAPALALAGQPALSPGAQVTAGDAIGLFDAVCLAHHPDFRGSGDVLDEYGFAELETALPRTHPEKMLQAIVMPLLPGDAAGARSCVVMAAGIGLPEVDAGLEPLIETRLGQSERHHDAQIDVPHAVWVSRADSLQTKIVLAEQGGGTVIAASVTPLQGQSQ